MGVVKLAERRSRAGRHPRLVAKGGVRLKCRSCGLAHRHFATPRSQPGWERISRNHPCLGCEQPLPGVSFGDSSGWVLITEDRLRLRLVVSEILVPALVLITVGTVMYLALSR